MISKYPLKRYPNIKRELRIKTLTDMAIRDGLPATKEHFIKNLKLSETTWKKYEPIIRERLGVEQVIKQEQKIVWVKANELKK